MGEVVYRLAPDHQEELIGRHQLTITPGEQDYTLISHGNDPFFFLPAFNSGEGKQYVIKINLDAPEATNWQIWYGPHCISGQLEAGENTLYAVIGQGQIRVDPGSVMGKYVLKSLEIRAVKRQGSR
jgi:hypothetical protein